MKDEIASTTVRDAVFQVMRDMGATKIFGNPGSTELPMFRDFPEDFDYVLGLQEAVVVGMPMAMRRRQDAWRSPISILLPALAMPWGTSTPRSRTGHLETRSHDP